MPHISRRLASLALIICVSSLLFVPIASAAPVTRDYYINILSNESVFCFTYGFSVDYYVNAHLSYASSFSYTLTLNGVQQPANSGNLPAPYSSATLIHSMNYSTFAASPIFFQTGPFTVVAREVRKYTAGPNAGQVISDYTFRITCPTPDNDPFGVVGTWTIVPTPAGTAALSQACTYPDSSDGRLNSTCGDAAQTAAFYCSTLNGTTSLNLYWVWNSKGSEDFKVTQADLDKVPDKPTTNTLIKAGKYLNLYRLTTGELQVNTYTGDAYIFPGVDGAPATVAQICGTFGKAFYKIDAPKP